MRFFFYSKYSFITTVVFTVFTVSSIYSLYTYSASRLGSKNLSDDIVTIKAHDFDYSNYDVDGDLESYLQSEYLEQYLDKSIKLDKIHVKTYDKDVNQKWDVTADVARTSGSAEDKGVINLKGNVKAITFTDDKEDDGTPKKIYIDTEEINYNQKTKDFYGDDFVKIYDPKVGNETTGIGIEGNSESKTLTINNDVRSYYASK